MVIHILWLHANTYTYTYTLLKNIKLANSPTLCWQIWVLLSGNNVRLGRLGLRRHLGWFLWNHIRDCISYRTFFRILVYPLHGKYIVYLMILVCLDNVHVSPKSRCDCLTIIIHGRFMHFSISRLSMCCDTFRSDTPLFRHWRGVTDGIRAVVIEN